MFGRKLIIAESECDVMLQAAASADKGTSDSPKVVERQSASTSG